MLLYKEECSQRTNSSSHQLDLRERSDACGEEEAQPEGDIAVNEIAEADHLEAQAQRDLDSVAEEGDVIVEDNAREVGIVVVEAIHALDDGGDGEADPHQRVFEESVEHAGPPWIVLQHGDGQLDQWED